MSDQRDPGDPSLPLSIETPAVTAAQQAVASYLQRVPPGAGTLGVVIGLSGPPGAGKTHLATRIVRRLHPPPAGDADGRAHLLAIGLRADEANGNQLYTAFVDAMTRTELTAAVRDHLAGPFSPSAGQEWPSDSLRARLTTVVGDRGYATALAQLTHPELADEAWAWLRGGLPSARLAERGLLGPAVGGLPGIGVLARFWLGRGRLVLVVDDVDRLVRGPDRAQRIDAVRRLLEELRTSGCLVFVTGSAEALSDVEIGPYRRLGTRIDLGGFDADTAASYLRARTGTGTLGPFELPAVTRLVELTDGNPARLTGLVDRLLRAPRDPAGPITAGPITAEVVTAEARRQLSAVDRPTVAAAIRRVLDGLLGSVPLAFSAAYQATLEQAGRLDFWIPMTTPGPGTAGCGVLIADPIVVAADLQPLIATADALTRADTRAEVLVVLTGPVSAVHLERLRHEFRREPLPYVSGTFDDDLAVAVKAMIQSFDDQGEAAQFAGLNRRIEHIDRQQLRTLDAIQQMSAQLDALRPDQATTAAAAADDRLPAPVHDVFCRVLGALGQLDAAPSAARGLFALGGPTAEDTRNGLRRTTDADSATLRAFGSVSLIEAVVQEFRAAIRRWFDSTGAFPGLPPNSVATATLVELCTRYDDVINAIDLADLHRLQPISGSAPGPAARVDLATRAIRDLGRNVRTAVELTER